jgi:GT2 family glycosyltransferase
VSTHSERGISVAIANWNGGQHILQCLGALLAQTLKPHDIVVVDNGSTDGSPDLVRRSYPQVRLLTRPRNEGFCGGYNRAILASSCPYVLILNSDIFLDQNFLERAKSAVEADPMIGWISARITHAKDRESFDYVGQYLRLRVALANSLSPHDGEDVFAGSGSAIFCRRGMLEDIAFRGEIYDEDFFAYIEDLDLAWRAQLRGWRCVYRSDVIAQHIGSASQEGHVRVIEKPPEFIAHIIKNRYLTLVKNATPGLLVRFLPVFVLGELFLWTLLAIRNPWKVAAIPNALSQAFSALPRALEKRRHIMHRRVVPDRRIVALTSGV